MSFSSNAWTQAADTAPESEPGKPWEPLADNDDDGGDHTAEVEPEI